jgi:flavin-dependent dehydrogenase
MQHEVAVIGGGPAGCAAALTLRSIGCSVILIATSSQKQRPTETAVPGLAPTLRSLDASEALAACEPCYGIVSAWGRQAAAFEPAITNPHGHAWFVHRSRFDTILHNLVRNHGIEWIDGEVYKMACNQEGAILFTDAGRIHTRSVIIATGSPPSAARLTGQKVIHLDSMVAFWAQLSAPLEQRLLLVESAEQGWWYLCPADGPGAIACFMTDPASARSLLVSDPSRWNRLFLATELAKELNTTPEAKSVSVALTGLAALPIKTGPHWAAVGDAAARLDPLGSSGTITALESGQRAACALADALRGNTSGLDLYARWSSGLFEEFVRQRRHQYKAETHKRSTAFWSRRATLSDSRSVAA